MKFRSLSRKAALLSVAVMTLLSSSLFLYTSKTAHAAPITDFNAGNIIDDGVFYNQYAMGVTQIQNFLNTLIPNCDTWGTQPSGYGNLSNAQYAQQIKGWPGPPYVCLNQYYENPNTGETSFEKGGGAFAGGISAAQIIYNAAQTYGINPQVLLVMIKKESPGPLTADTWPLKSQYKYTMGYACPDGPTGAECDASKAGFYKQVMLAAWQLNYYKQHPNDYRYHLGWNDIQYSPDASCGTKRVYIENLATLSLYIYTPYTPSDASLAAYPGQVSCGSYGNRNFYAYFKEWFGISVAPELNARYVALGGSTGVLGKPIEANWCSGDRSICYQHFQNGYIIYSTTTGAWESKGGIRDYWGTIGYQNGIAGFPTGPETYDAATGTWSQTYQNGVITGNGSIGFWFVNSNIYTRWGALGGNRSTLGSPRAATIGSSYSAYQQFQNGYVIYSTPTGAWESKGAIRDYWAKIGFQSGAAGFPTGAEAYDAATGTWSQPYQNGTIYYSSALNGSFVAKPIDSYWASGARYSGIGMPKYSTVGNLSTFGWQEYQNGFVVGNTTTGFWMSKGAIRTYWAKIGFQNGIAGFPIGSEQYDQGTGTYSQPYQNGTIYYKDSTGAWFVAS